MRYLLQAMVMLSDIAVMTACAVALFFFYQNLFVWLIVVAALKTWKKTGGFGAWRPSRIKEFLFYARQRGL